MKSYNFIFLVLLLCQSIYGQNSCFDDANKYRSQYLNQDHISFDSLTVHLKKGEEMIVNCLFPNDTFTTVKNKHTSLKDFKGKILVINFWSIHCAPCINEIPSFHALTKKYNKDLAVLAFTLDSKEEISNYLQKHEFNVEVIADAKLFVQKYSLGSGLPFSILVDKTGKIIYVKSGGETDPEKRLDLYNELSPVIDKSLQKK